MTPIVTTENPTLGHTLERERIEQLPINGRFLYTLLLTVPDIPKICNGKNRIFWFFAYDGLRNKGLSKRRRYSTGWPGATQARAGASTPPLCDDAYVRARAMGGPAGFRLLPGYNAGNCTRGALP